MFPTIIGGSEDTCGSLKKKREKLNIHILSE